MDTMKEGYTTTPSPPASGGEGRESWVAVVIGESGAMRLRVCRHFAEAARDCIVTYNHGKKARGSVLRRQGQWSVNVPVEDSSALTSRGNIERSTAG